jgi:hypothetical protein
MKLHLISFLFKELSFIARFENPKKKLNQSSFDQQPSSWNNNNNFIQQHSFAKNLQTYILQTYILQTEIK